MIAGRIQLVLFPPHPHTLVSAGAAYHQLRGQTEPFEYHTSHHQRTLLKAGWHTREKQKGNSDGEEGGKGSKKGRGKEKKKKQNRKRESLAPFGVLLATNKRLYQDKSYIFKKP